MNNTRELRFKVQLLDEDKLRRTMMRLSYEIIEKNADLSKIVLIGIKTRGVPLAEMIRENILKNTGIGIDLGTLDIKYYRDDLEKIDANPLLKKETFSFDINDKEIILVDDVLFTGRTVRAAIDAIFDQGRPAKVSLLVLIDRGHRELPFRPDYVGKNIPTSLNEVISVNISPYDDKTNVELLEIIQ
ncbi:MAG: bifunctional pyr operon transcriptional regulator/uracil phosphoribosyltransferase PyrR [Erysipelotrichaceae bacterium]|nr:bifunctional pyr operon transcriptional regulator/uracil phosphoribosyltransferase PyrR [Erysipelotrichaceae bacterium]